MTSPPPMLPLPYFARVERQCCTGLTLLSSIISCSLAAHRPRKSGSLHHAAAPSCPATVMIPAITRQARMFTPALPAVDDTSSNRNQEPRIYKSKRARSPLGCASSWKMDRKRKRGDVNTHSMGCSETQRDNSTVSQDHAIAIAITTTTTTTHRRPYPSSRRALFPGTDLAPGRRTPPSRR